MVVHSLINALGLMNPLLQVVTPSKASYKDLAMYHSRDYLDTVLDPSLSANQVSNATEFGLEDVSVDIVATPYLLLHVLVVQCSGLSAICGLA